MDWQNLQLSFWMSKGNTKNLLQFLNSWFLYLRSLLLWPIQQFDLDTCALFIVDMIAWERDVERFNQEPEWLYRRRVKFAYANARDAGTVAGFKRIWERMQLGYLEIEERIDGRDWDVVNLVVSESAVSENPELLDIIIEKYGRTCRRYEWTTIANTRVNIRTATIEHSSEYITAKLELN